VLGPGPVPLLFSLCCLDLRRHTSCSGKCASSSSLSVLLMTGFSWFSWRLIYLQFFDFNSTNVSADHTGHLHLLGFIGKDRATAQRRPNRSLFSSWVLLLAVVLTSVSYFFEWLCHFLCTYLSLVGTFWGGHNGTTNGAPTVDTAAYMGW